MKRYIFIFIYILVSLFLFSINILSFPSDISIYPEKIPAIELKFPYSHIFDYKILYKYSIINKDNDERSKFIGSAISSFLEEYFVDKKIRFDNKEKKQLITFIFDKLAIFFQKQRSINNQFTINPKFLEEIYNKDFNLIEDKDEDEENKKQYNLINFEISYQYDIKSSKITIYCKKYYIFNQQVFEATFEFHYNYITFYGDFKKIFINKILSFLLNFNFHTLAIELSSSAFVEIDGKVLGHFEDIDYPSTFEFVLEEGEHEINLFEDGYDSIKQKIDLEDDQLISIKLNKKINHCLLKINTFPAGSKVMLGNIFVGNSPVRLELPTGKHFLLISNSGYESKEIFIEIYDNDFEKEIYVYLMPVNTTPFYADYSKKILNQVYSYFWYGCYGIAASIIGSILYNYFVQFEYSPFYGSQQIGIYGSLIIIAGGLITFAIFEIMSLTELWKYYQYITYYTI